MYGNLKNVFSTNKIIENPLKNFQQKAFNECASKISFKVDKFIHKELQWYMENYNTSYSSFIQLALKDFLKKCKELDLAPFQLEHWYNCQNNFEHEYDVVLDKELKEEFLRLKNIYKQQGIRFNKSHIVRCAVADRIANIIMGDSNETV
ncbi:unknown [Clostridium sp. CAG:306]|nr:unknown [Clostridium sp. CAG:306]